MHFWLMKTEPNAFSLDDLISRPGQTEPWDGVRNYQARNMMRDEMKVGDLVFFYHSNCDVPGIVGIARIAREAYPDPTAFDATHKHYDPGSSQEKPRWLMVDLQFVRRLQRVISLAELKTHASKLDSFTLLRKGNRLSVMPVDARHWAFIETLENI